jgi:glutathione S-transferase
MILIGQYDSPFVRRVGIALTLYGMSYEHRPWSVFGDGDRIAPLNPLRRVPTLVCDDGVALGESHAILDYLDGLVGPGRALYPPSGDARRDAIRIAGLAAGLADKAVSLFYEQKLHDQMSDLWADRCRLQIADTLRLLEQDRSAQGSAWWSGADLGHADIMSACAWRFVNEAHPGLIDQRDHPALAAHAARCEALDTFTLIRQPFIPPA